MIRYQITNGEYSEDPAGWFRTLRDDVDYIQVRERDLNGRALAALVKEVRHRTRVPLLVNDRIDVAIASGAAGVHLRANAVPAARVVRLAPLIVTVSCHNETEILASRGAALALAAPVFSPGSKSDARPPLGLETLARFARISPTPVIALGGVTAENAPLCLAAGAAGIAGITLWRRP